MNVSNMIREAFQKKGFRNLKEASKALGISQELVRLVIYHGHIPKDNTLKLLAGKLELDQSVLILAAHQQRVPSDVKGFFLSPVRQKQKHGKRKFPLSEEQCNYLEKIMTSDEIQIVRIMRQVTDDAKGEINGYVNFIYEKKKDEHETAERFPRHTR